MRTSHLLPLLAVMLLGSLSGTANAPPVPLKKIWGPELQQWFDQVCPDSTCGFADKVPEVRYWGIVEHGHDCRDLFLWNYPRTKLTGDDYPDFTLGGGLDWVRLVSAHPPWNHKPGVLLGGLNAELWPYTYPFVSGNYTMRLYGRLIGAGPDTVVVTVQATWHDEAGAKHTVSWGGVDHWAVYASDLGEGQWTLTNPKHFVVQNPEGCEGFQWEDLEVTWTGARDLEIDYLTISADNDNNFTDNSR